MMTKGSQTRRDFKRLKKAQTALGRIPGAIPEVSSLGGDLAALRKAVEDTYMLRDAVAIMVNDVQRLIYEHERSRAVTLRLMQTVSKGPGSGLVLGTAAPRSFTVDQLQAMEEQYIAEYDAICALIAFVNTHAREE